MPSPAPSPAPLRWGILATGSIAGTFARGLAHTSTGRLVAVGSRSRESAERFTAAHGGLRAHGSYAALAQDPEVDAVYIATPHPQHLACAELCLAHGKAVLCEKPLTVNALEAERLIAAATRHRRFLMEAMWTRFLPAMVEVRRLVQDGAIGEVRMVSADFGFRGGDDPRSRTLDPALAGGALLDVGIYCLALGTMLLGREVVEVQALAHRGATGVDEQVAMLLRWGGGQLAVLSAAVRTTTPQGAWIAGTTGRIDLPDFWHGRTLTLHREGKPSETIAPPFVGNGYHYQAEEVARAVAAGALESPVLPWAESLALQRLMDRIRAQVGVRYPMDPPATAHAR